MERYRKVIDGKVIVKSRNNIIVVIGGKQYINPSRTILLADGWEEYKPVINTPTEEEIAAQEAEDKVNAARDMLATTDYKVIKCMEAFLCGEDLPYDIRELHTERNEQRRLINENENYGETSSNL